jgi:hypothetical protein
MGARCRRNRTSISSELRKKDNKMAGFGIFNAKDIDGRWWSFSEQQRDLSCGPTCVKIAKELYHNQKIGEEVIRGLVGLQYSGRSNTGITLVQAARASDGRWRLHGAIEDMVLPAVQRQPLAIPQARFVHGIQHLRSASRNRPAILGFNWDNGGGHFVVCVGPTRTDPSLFVILDPDDGLQYLSADDAVGKTFYYNPSYGSRGQIDSRGYIITT